MAKKILDGADRLQKKLEALAKLPTNARRTISEAIKKSADATVNTIKNFVPVRSGALKNSVKYTMGQYTPDNANVRGVAAGDAGDPDLTAIISAGDKTAFYARWVEFGTAPHIAGGKFKGAENPGAKAEPYFFPGYRANKKLSKSRINRAMRKAIKDIVK